VKKKSSKAPKNSKKMYLPEYQEPTQVEARFEAEEQSYESVDSILCEESFEDTIEQDADQDIDTLQYSGELIVIRDSENVNVQTTDTQAAVNLQVALQVAIALVIQISIADSTRAEQVTQSLLQQLDVKQVNRQKIIIDNSRDVSIITTDTDVSVNIQALLQALLAIVAKIDVL